MRAALDQFEQNLARVRSLVGLSESVSNLTTPVVDFIESVVHAIYEVAR